MSKPQVIAVDFDGVICENKYPDIGKENNAVLSELLFRQACGDKIILWSCRSDEKLDEAIAWCKKRGLVFDAVNDNLQEHIDAYGNNCRKVWADEYWDDKAVRIETE